MQVAAAGWAGIEIDNFPKLKAWEERMTARAGVEKGRHVPDRHTIKELLKDKEKMEKHAAESRKWVQAGMYVPFSSSSSLSPLLPPLHSNVKRRKRLDLIVYHLPD